MKTSPILIDTIVQHHFDAIANERSYVTPVTVSLSSVPARTLNKPAPDIFDITVRQKNAPFFQRFAASLRDYLVGQPRGFGLVEGRILHYPEYHGSDRPSIVLSIRAVEQGHFEALWNAGHELADALACDDVFVCNFNGAQQPTQRYIEEFKRKGKVEIYTPCNWRSKEYQRRFS